VLKFNQVSEFKVEETAYMALSDNVLKVVEKSPPVLSVTPAAVAIIQELLEQREIPDHALRVFVSGGGCSGMQYGMAFEAEAREYDQVVDVDGVRMIVDSIIPMPFLLVAAAIPSELKRETQRMMPLLAVPAVVTNDCGIFSL
jgi:iron-sulfur cluster assembly accessory protein